MTSHNDRARASLTLGLLLGGAAIASGCSRVDAYRLNPSPSEETFSQSSEEVANALTVTNDTYFRALNQDLGRLFLLERPSRMNLRAIPY